jgi:hypothetical protein
MKRMNRILCCLGAMTLAAGISEGQVRISQVYGGGGATSGTPTYTKDYVELFNAGGTAQSLNGLSIQYGSATGNWGSSATNIFVLPNVTLNPGQYFLVTLGGVGTTGGTIPVAADADSTNVNISATNGKVALINGTTFLNSAACPPPNVLDYVAFGTGNCPEGTATAVLTNTSGLVRKTNGCTDTGNNANDFDVVTAPVPRNSGSPTNQCGVTTGACCVGLVCSITASNACSGSYQGGGSVCTPNPCLPAQGSCCVGFNCTVVSLTDCTTAGGAWTLNGLCTPNPCPVELVGLVGDIALGRSVASVATTALQARGGVQVGTWSRFAFLQSMEYDNAFNSPHNARGNLLALNFGATPLLGGFLYSLSTNGTNNGQQIFAFDGVSFGTTATRVAGLSVSPNNQLAAVIGSDSGRVIVLGYDAGASAGTGAGASILGAAETNSASFIFATGVSSGTEWLNDSTLIVFVNNYLDAPLGTPAIVTIPVSGTQAAPVLGAPTFRLNTNDTGVPNGSRFLSIAYNPAISPFLYTLSSGFVNPTSGTRLSVIDVTTWTEVRSIDISTSLQTGREIAIGADRFLYLGQFSGAGTTHYIDRLNLDTNSNGSIDAADAAALADNSTVDFLAKGTGPDSSFNGLDIATTASTGAPATGACCLGVGCTVTTAATCTGTVGTTVRNFRGVGTVCNAPGTPPFTNATTPCCFADFNQNGVRNPTDIFNFLANYFDASPAIKATTDTNGNGTQQPADIFGFLTLYFAGGCG